MYPYPYPENTKQPKTYNQDFLKPILSNTPEPLRCSHDNYMLDSYATMIFNNDLERGSISTRNFQESARKPVQNAFQNNYYNFNDTVNNDFKNLDTNNFLTRNTVNTRRDNFDKIRNIEKNEFMKFQGGNLGNYTDFKIENTRKDKKEINTNGYIPMPRTMAIPKENI
jgi:hypothetical protein